MSIITAKGSGRARRVRLAAGITVTTVGLMAHHAMRAVWAAPGDPIDKPNPGSATDAPGVQGFKDLANALSLYTLLACLIGGLLSALMAVAGGAISDRIRESGKIGIVASLLIAFIVGVLWAGINWFYKAGAGT